MFPHSHWIDCGREQELPSCGSSPGQLLSSAGSPPGSPPPPDSSPAISVIIFRKHSAVAEWCEDKVKDIRQDWRYGRFPILPLLESYSRKEKKNPDNNRLLQWDRFRSRLTAGANHFEGQQMLLCYHHLLQAIHANISYVFAYTPYAIRTNKWYVFEKINDEEVAVVKTNMAPFSSQQGPFVVASTCKIGSFLGSLSSHFSSGTALIPKLCLLSDLNL